MVKRWILTFLLVSATSLSLACGGSSSSSSSNTHAQAAVAIALNPAPASTSVAVGSPTGIQFTPVVSNDAANAGVDWALTCPLTAAGACGSLSISNFHSASGTAVSYIPPASFLTGTLSVNVTVFATADHTKNVTTAITVTSYTNVLSGTYVLQIQGSDEQNPNPYQSTGIFVLDGMGNITSGQQTLNTLTGFSTTYTVQDPSVAASTYFIGPDGRGTMILNLQQTGTGSGNQETLTFTVISSAQALVAELDSNSGSGTLELQDTTAAATMPTGAYAFVSSGSDFGANPNLGGPVPTALGGIFNIDNNPFVGSIDGIGSLGDMDYYNATFVMRVLQSCVPPTGVTGSVSKPVAPGIVTIILTGATCFGQPQPSTIQFTGYIVDATHIRLIESDDIDGTKGYLTAGIAVSQGSAAGTFTDASLTGSYVFGVLGYDVNAGIAEPASLSSAGVIDAAGDGTFTEINDTFYLVTGFAYNANTLPGTYTIDANGIGRVNVPLRFAGFAPTPRATLLLYLTGNGTPPLLLWSEGFDVNYPAVGTGTVYVQAAGASTLSFGNPETYGFNLTQNNGSNEVDASGEMVTTYNGVAGSITGQIEDFNSNDFNGGAALPLNDTFTLPADQFGRIAGTLRNSLQNGPGPFFEYYMVDDNRGVMTETDLLESVNSPGVSVGYFAQACDVTSTTSCALAAAKRSSARTQRKPGSRILKKNSKITVH